jgi:hypothetical protein
MIDFWHLNFVDCIQIASAIGTIAAAVVGWRAASKSADLAAEQLPELRKQATVPLDEVYDLLGCPRWRWHTACAV